MKKAIQVLLVLILVFVLALIVVFVFNPLDLRTKLIASVVNSYLSSTIENYEPLKTEPVSAPAATGEKSDTAPVVPAGVPVDKNPLLSEDQEKILEKYGVDVSKLPTSISPAMEACLVEKVGQDRAKEIVGGALPTAIEIFKAQSCLGK